MLSNHNSHQKPPGKNVLDTFHGIKMNPPVSLHAYFKLERKFNRLLVNDKNMHYLTDNDAKLFEITFHQNKGHNHHGALLHGSYLFVLTAHGNPRLLACNDDNLHHSDLANGKKVFAAGELVFNAGALIEVTNKSGHYKPDNTVMVPMIKILCKHTQNPDLIYSSYSQKSIVRYPAQAISQAGSLHHVKPLLKNEFIVNGKRIANTNYERLIDENIKDTSNQGLILNQNLKIYYQNFLKFYNKKSLCTRQKFKAVRPEEAAKRPSRRASLNITR